MMRIIPLVAASLGTAVLVFGCSSSESSGGADAGSDGSTVDVRAEAHPPPADDHDSGDAGSTGGCPIPAEITSWVPPALVPVKTSPGACSASQFTGYDAACLNAVSGTAAACTAFQLANTACTDCLNSNSTDATWGPLVSWGGVVDLNAGGCLQLLAPSDDACALAVQTAHECPYVACDAVCPVTQANSGSFPLWQDCAKAADADACASFIAQSMCLSTDPAAAGTICNANVNATFENVFLQIAPLFCGAGDGGLADGGSAEAGPTEGGETDSASTDADGE